MGPSQQCKTCRVKYSENAPEKNYDNWMQYGFNSKDDFKKHSSRNNKCPAKQNNIENVIISSISHIPKEDSCEEEEESVIKETIILENVDELPLWPDYEKYKDNIDKEDYTEDQIEVKNREKRHHKNNDVRLWHITSEIASNDLMEGILNDDIHFMTLVAEPGSGKTAVTHNLLFKILTTMTYGAAINPKNITSLTGMSDIEWFLQLIDSYTLKDGRFLWDEINRLEKNHCIVHRSNFHKRITYILDNLELIHGHIFIIDESHFADSKDMTIDIQLQRLGLTLERMKEYNIKIICISATPDVNLSIMARSSNHNLIKLEPGENYKGFKYFKNKNMIIDYDINLNIETKIRGRYKSPRYHFIRARTNIEKGKFQQSIKEIVTKNNWILIEDDSYNNFYLSFKNDNNEKTARDKKKIIVKTYEEPLRHTIILIKDKYSASKRLKLTSFTGLVVEKPAKKRNTTTTCNGLVPRFWMYGEEPEYKDNELPLFICDKISVDEYIIFSETFVLNGKDYTSNRLVSKSSKIIEKKNTCYTILAGEEAITQNSDIQFDSFTGIMGITEVAHFLRGKQIQVEDILLESFNERNGYYFPKRNVLGHTYNNETDTYMTEETYKKYKNNGGGSFINRSEEGQGQRFMIYPVYKKIGCNINELTWRVHYYENTESN